MRTIPEPTALGLQSGLGQAEEAAVFTYLEFEASVPHFDVGTCPASMPSGQGFCRVVFNNDAVHVFRFSEKRDQPLLALRTYEEGDCDLVFK